MAGAATGAKRARAAAFTAHEKYMHKSSAVLQREGKKIRGFLAQKAIAQLKQTREQHAAASAAVESAAGELEDTKLKRLQGKAKKLFYQVDKHEKELAVLKSLDLKAVVARAFEKTGLKVDEPAEESDDDSDDGRAPTSAHDREMAKYGRGRVATEHKTVRKGRVEEEEEEVEEDDEEDDERVEPMVDDEVDDGFNSEDYDEVPRSDSEDSEEVEQGEEDEAQDSEEQEEEEESEDDDEDDTEEEMDVEEDVDEELHVVEAEEIAEGAVLFGPMGPPGTDQRPSEANDEAKEAAVVDPALIDQLIERVLSHNQMKPFLDAIRQYVEKKERDEAKKRRQKEKSALKRARASMVGGRSSAAPKSMFFGSLSGDAPDDDDDVDVGFGRASMAGAEDDIADFLGETKKKKNRPGQMARRQKAIRMEETRRGGEEDGGAGGFQKRRFNSRDAPAVGKYGPSERPKKQQKRDAPLSRGTKPRGDGSERASSSWKDRDSNRDFKKPSVEDKRHERRGRADSAPAPKAPRASAPHRKPEVEPSHPSWLAKQALKEKMKVDINAFSGKKITFGDD